MKLNSLFKLIWKYRHIWGPILIKFIKPVIRYFKDKKKKELKKEENDRKK